MASFIEKVEAQWAKGKHVCVGLDPDIRKVPGHIISFDSSAKSIYRHMCEAVKATAHIAAAYKPNTAFYESFGWKGLEVLEHLIGYIKDSAPEVPIILDAKRGDIGNTNEHYAKMAFDCFGADAITIHPYLGYEANKPFLDRADKGIFVLCRTSNPGAGEFQDTRITSYEVGEDPHGSDAITKETPLFQVVTKHAADPELWNYNGNCGLVTGATYPEEIRKVRGIAPDIPLLIPGVGKQGGDIEASVRAAKHRFLINSSSGIIFADNPKAEAEKLQAEIQEALASR
jgi:orotidine-5'-phosphate decarboxylase